MIKRLLFAIALCMPCSLAADPQLYMAEEQGCYWCETWKHEVGHIYPKTGEGKAAPLVVFDLHDDDPDVEFARGIHYTPTFILVDDGKELGRIEGYPGDEFFWGLLGLMLKDNNIAYDVYEKEAS